MFTLIFYCCSGETMLYNVRHVIFRHIICRCRWPQQCFVIISINNRNLRSKFLHQYRLSPMLVHMLCSFFEQHKRPRAVLYIWCQRHVTSQLWTVTCDMLAQNTNSSIHQIFSAVLYNLQLLLCYLLPQFSTCTPNCLWDTAAIWNNSLLT